MMRLEIPHVTGPVATGAWIIEGVPAADAHVPWRRCWPLLQKAIDRFPQVSRPLIMPEVWEEVANGKAQLWIAWSCHRQQIEGAVITRLVASDDEPGKTLCQIPLWGGENLQEWGGQMLGLIKSWARVQGASFLVGYGRRGWSRLFGARIQGQTSDGLPVMVLPVEE